VPKNVKMIKPKLSNCKYLIIMS